MEMQMPMYRIQKLFLLLYIGLVFMERLISFNFFLIIELNVMFQIKEVSSPLTMLVFSNMKKSFKL
jgi:hypothetical protein